MTDSPPNTPSQSSAGHVFDGPHPAADAGILCVGEVLWDALPEGLFLGGALYNVARHLHALGQPVQLVSRVGDDTLGREILRRMRAAGLSTDLVQIDADHRTGFVEVRLDAEGVADYVIVEPVAWDAIATTKRLASRAETAQALVFGSLAQRSDVSRRTIQTLCDVTNGVTVYDVNLRPPYTSRDVVEASMRAADVVKLNDDELTTLRGWYDLPSTLTGGVETLGDRFDVATCCVTCGPDGAYLWHDGAWTYHAGFDVAVRDTVGAGDSFLAALLAGLLAGDAPDDVLRRANRLGAFVASRSGATPEYDVPTLDAISTLSLST